MHELDLEGWGYRELGMAAELLDKYSDRPSVSGLEYPIKLGFNLSSANVFLFDDNGNVAMMNGDKLEPFYSCPECGYEGFADEIEHEGGKECRRFVRETLAASVG